MYIYASMLLGKGLFYVSVYLNIVRDTCLRLPEESPAKRQNSNWYGHLPYKRYWLHYAKKLNTYLVSEYGATIV